MAQGTTPTVPKGARPKRVVMQPPVQQQMPSAEVETLSHMLRMTGELREEAGLRMVLRPQGPATTSKASGQQAMVEARSANAAHERDAEVSSPQSVTSSSTTSPLWSAILTIAATESRGAICNCESLHIAAAMKCESLRTVVFQLLWMTPFPESDLKTSGA